MKNFLFNLFRKTTEIGKKEYYFGLILKEEEGWDLLLEIDQRQNKIRKIDEKKFIYSDSWEQINDDVDKVLFELEKKNNIRVEKTILILYSHLVDQKTKEVKKPYLGKIKHLVKELELKLLGYIEHHEAISLYFKKTEGVPLTSIIIELDKSSVSLFIYKGGEFVFSDSIARTEDLIADLQTILDKIKEEIILPSRMVIYNSSGLEEESDKIITHRWQENLFIQIPKVEILNYEKLKEILIFSFSQQIFEGGKVSIIKEKKQEEILGFVIGKDIKEIVSRPQMETEISEAEELQEDKFQLRLPFRLPPLPIKFNLELQAPVLLLIGLVLIFSSIFVVLFYLHKASLDVYFQGKKIEKEIDIKDEPLIKKIDEIVEKEDSIGTSGKKIVGEKARGEVTIYNSDLTEKEFTKDTVLTTSSGIKFILDAAVKVASASQSLTSDGNLLTVTGKTKAKITAYDIGPSGNISKDEKLKIGEFPLSLFFALPTASFSGGSKQELQTVSKEDMNKLRELVLEKIKTEGNTAITNKLKNIQIIDKLTKIEIIDEKYSKELAEETKNLSLKIKSKVTFYTFNKNDARKVIFNSLSGLIDPNYELSVNSINYALKKVEEKDEKIVLTVDVSAKTMVKIDEKQLVHQLLGRSLSDAEKVIKEKFKARAYEVKIKKDLPFLKSRLPFFEKNIDLRIKSL